MKRILITLALVCSILSISAITQQPKTQWEYKFDYKCYEKGANEMGAQGWEIVSSTMNTYSNVITQMCVYKRAK